MILEKLHSLKESKYQEFSQKLVPTRLEILGVRMPNLRALAKEIAKSKDAFNFINSQKDEIYELVLLEGLVIGYLNLELIEKLKLYENYIEKADNWALIDSVKFSGADKFSKDEKELLLNHIKTWLKSKDENGDENEFIVRGGLVNLLYYFVSLENLEFIFSLKFQSGKYYITMAHAWLLAECMAKFPKETLNFMQNSSLDKTTHNKAISKMRESFRVSDKDKKLLLSLKK
ncbi:MAG: DNA alkylation repair protein [Campylobacteraceae bacterium]|nr:DNA alkylation repair protein [Campylobacteraceae bacterium]